MATFERGLGRKAPTDWKHYERFPFATTALPSVGFVERVLRLPRWHKTHDQGQEGSCVGHGVAFERSITNYYQNKVLQIVNAGRRYDTIDIWNNAKRIDEWDDTNPGDDNGTSVRAAYEVMRILGPRRVKKMEILPGTTKPTAIKPKNRDPKDGIEVYRWARSVDEVRTAIAHTLPVTIGVNWYQNFYSPAEVRNESWIGRGDDLGQVRGGHCVCIYGASDRRQAVKIKNSWGNTYPEVWMPYETLQRLINEDGEVALVTDR